MLQMNYATLIYYARLGAQASLAEVSRNELAAIEAHDNESFESWDRERAYIERLLDAFNEIWSGLSADALDPRQFS